jgi:hypothetical protein
MKRSTKIRFVSRGAPMLFYPAALPLSRRTLAYVSGIIRRYRRQIGSCWRKLNPGRQALLVLAYLRKGETFADLAAGFGIGTATAWRYVNETVALLAARSPKLGQALAEAGKAGLAHVVPDGTLVPIDRLAADRPFYSGKHRRHGMNPQVIASPDGDIVWVSGPLPGAVPDLNAARIWGIIRELAASGLVMLADKGYHGAGEHIHTPYKGRNKLPSQKAANRAHAPCALPVSGPTPSSRPGTYCANSAAARGVPGSSPRRSTSFRPARSPDEAAGTWQPPARNKPAGRTAPSAAANRRDEPTTQDPQLGNPACVGVEVGRLLADIIPARIADPEAVDNALTAHDLAGADIEDLVDVIGRLKPLAEHLLDQVTRRLRLPLPTGRQAPEVNRRIQDGHHALPVLRHQRRSETLAHLSDHDTPYNPGSQAHPDSSPLADTATILTKNQPEPVPSSLSTGTDLERFTPQLQTWHPALASCASSAKGRAPGRRPLARAVHAFKPKSRRMKKAQWPSERKPSQQRRLTYGLGTGSLIASQIASEISFPDSRRMARFLRYTAGRPLYDHAGR